MSRPFSRYLHPLDRVPRPVLEPEVEKAIIANWAQRRPDRQAGSSGAGNGGRGGR